jgi:hypothetical protein
MPMFLLKGRFRSSALRAIEIAFSASESLPARNSSLFEAAVHANTELVIPRL